MLVLLKAQRTPTRSVETEAGPGVDVWTDGAWRNLDLDPPARDPSLAVSFGELFLPKDLGQRASELVEDSGRAP